MSWGNGKHVEGQQGPHVLEVTCVPDTGSGDRDLFPAVSFAPQCRPSSRTWGTCQRTTVSLALSLMRAVHEAGTRRGSRLRQKLMPSGFCWAAEVLLLRCKSCCWECGRGLAFLNLFLISTSLSGKWTLWDIDYVRAEHPLQHALTTTRRNDLSLKIFPLFSQLAGYQFFWGTWKQKIITSFELITPQNNSSLWGSLLTLIRVCYSLFRIFKFPAEKLSLTKIQVHPASSIFSSVLSLEDLASNFPSFQKSAQSGSFLHPLCFIMRIRDIIFFLQVWEGEGEKHIRGALKSQSSCCASGAAAEAWTHHVSLVTPSVEAQKGHEFLVVALSGWMSHLNTNATGHRSASVSSLAILICYMETCTQHHLEVGDVAPAPASFPFKRYLSSINWTSSKGVRCTMKTNGVFDTVMAGLLMYFSSLLGLCLLQTDIICSAHALSYVCTIQLCTGKHMAMISVALCPS